MSTTTSDPAQGVTLRFGRTANAFQSHVAVHAEDLGGPEEVLPLLLSFFAEMDVRAGSLSDPPGLAAAMFVAWIVHSPMAANTALRHRADSLGYAAAARSLRLGASEMFPGSSEYWIDLATCTPAALEDFAFPAVYSKGPGVQCGKPGCAGGLATRFYDEGCVVLATCDGCGECRRYDQS